jgi:hypothetical protein
MRRNLLNGCNLVSISKKKTLQKHVLLNKTYDKTQDFMAVNIYLQNIGMSKSFGKFVVIVCATPSTLGSRIEVCPE